MKKFLVPSKKGSIIEAKIVWYTKLIVFLSFGLTAKKTEDDINSRLDGGQISA